MSFLANIVIHILGGIALLWAIVTPTPEHIQPVPLPHLSRTSTTPDVASTSPKKETTPATIVISTTTPQKKTPIVIPVQKVPPPPSAPVSKPIVLPPLPAPVEIIVPATTTPQITFADINTTVRKALVNILCTTKRSGSFDPLSGSGVIVNKRGIILTNAHVAEYFLLKDFLVPDFIECIVRTGEPARNAYKAKILYISIPWIERNAKKITEESPSGTGENDFAFLYITESTDPYTPLPSEFPAIQMNTSDTALEKPLSVLVAAYPAGFLGGISIQRDLYPASSVVQTGQLFGFRDSTPDLFSIGGSPVAQHGSSGGAVVEPSGKLLGLVVTATDAVTTGGRDLRAITMGHIARSFRQNAGGELQTLFDSDLPASVENFNRDVAPGLTKLLENALAPVH